MKMDKKVLTVLKGSIKKWERIVEGTGKDLGSLNCPLCRLFSRRGYIIRSRRGYRIRGEYCDGCPIYEKVKRRYCEETPYDLWVKHRDDCLESCETCEIHERLAEKELKFLKSLLPK
jgi:Pyruvate/2-oxoacid:ferredoxin oxidoreductase delta subunit